LNQGTHHLLSALDPGECFGSLVLDDFLGGLLQLDDALAYSVAQEEHAAEVVVVAVEQHLREGGLELRDMVADEHFGTRILQWLQRRGVQVARAAVDLLLDAALHLKFSHCCMSPKLR